MARHTTKVIVEVRKGDINRALKIFKRRGMDSGHLQKLKDNKQYTKPKTVRRKKKLDAIRRNNKEVMFEKWESGDNTITLFNEKKIKFKKSSNSEEKTIENYGLKLDK